MVTLHTDKGQLNIKYIKMYKLLYSNNKNNSQRTVQFIIVIY